VLYAGGAKAAPEAEWVALVRSVAGGDQLAFRALYDRTHRIVFTLSLRITNDRETAEEVTLDVFHDLWRRASRYDPAGGTVVGWIVNQARSRAIDRLRYERRRKRDGSVSGDHEPPVDDREPDQGLVRADQGQELRDALRRLSPGERQAIETAYFSGLSYAETAARLNQPLGTIKTRVRSGLEKLRQALGRRTDEP
jgi:RNA polymerase sigma-70 factor (ECF subfamily)